MKKLLLLAAIGSMAVGASAQRGNPAHEITPLLTNSTESAASNDGTNTGAEGTTATPFYTETFGSGTNTTMPIGWTADGNAFHTATWKWRKVPTASVNNPGLAAGAFSIGVLNSPTGGAVTSPTNDGWMVYDSDSIGSLNPTALPLEGYLNSPMVSCVGKSSVQLSFYQWFRRFRDSCYVDVSTNNFGTFTRYSVLPNNTMTLTNTNLPTNPTLSRINISATAANQANVRFRFYYKLDVNTNVGGAFAWLVDDVALAEIDPVEVGIDNASFIMTLRDNDLGLTAFSQYPKQLIDSIYPAIMVSNFGLTQQASSIQARIFRGTNATPVYNQSVVYTTPIGAVDSSIIYRNVGAVGYLPPTDTGLFTIAFSVNQTGDNFAANNADTAAFRLTDSLLSMNVGIRTTNWEVQLPAAPTAVPPRPLLHRQVGTWFEVSQGKSDTLTGISVAFNSTTTVGSTVGVQIYKHTVGQSSTGASAGYTLVGETRYKALTAADISSATALVATTFQIAPDVSFTPQDLILTGGLYAAVVRGQGNPAANTITLASSQSPAWGYLSSYGTLDTNDNQANSYTYASGGGNGHFVFNLGNSVPYVRAHFGNGSQVFPVSVKDVSIATLGTAYPNPANNKVSIPVTLSKGSEVTVSLSNAQGQILARQDLGKQSSGRGFEITFPTSNLAPGVYFYTVEAGGEKKTGRVVVAH